jgi:hypothetical protein
MHRSLLVSGFCLGLSFVRVLFLSGMLTLPFTGVRRGHKTKVYFGSPSLYMLLNLVTEVSVQHPMAEASVDPHVVVAVIATKLPRYPCHLLHWDYFALRIHLASAQPPTPKGTCQNLLVF